MEPGRIGFFNFNRYQVRQVSFHLIIEYMHLRYASSMLLFANLLLGQPPEHPITSLPYTPSLDIPSMDRSVDPCANFYLYSCGGWIQKNPLPPRQPRWNVYAQLAQEHQLFLLR